MRHISLSALRSRLDRPLELLDDGECDLPPRQQTMRAALGWSYDLLPTIEQTVFRGLPWVVPLGTPTRRIGQVTLARKTGTGDLCVPRFSCALRSEAAADALWAGEMSRTSDESACP